MSGGGLPAAEPVGTGIGAVPGPGSRHPPRPAPGPGTHPALHARAAAPAASPPAASVHPNERGRRGVADTVLQTRGV
ncbi:hypothetical protein [Streptomyces sp. NPDC060002]|uniref:hypothetical protein n=1 Tax=Streptomyces sp. NPDC060002 TaxID=3347033 RepID=UPI0036992796